VVEFVAEEGAPGKVGLTDAMADSVRGDGTDSPVRFAQAPAASAGRPTSTLFDLTA
jgi:hypothetical protein